MKTAKRTLAMLLAVVMTVGGVPLQIFATEEPASQASATYDDLYVSDGLIYKWDAFDMEEGDTAPTTLPNDIEGSELVATFTDTTATNHTAADGAILSRGVLQLGSLLPFHMVGDIKVLDDVTVEVAMFQQDYSVASGSAENGTLVMPNLTQYLRAYNNGTASGSQPVDETYGFISATGGAKGAPREGTNYVRVALDGGWVGLGGTKVKFFGNTKQKTYQIAFGFDYTVAEGAYEGILDLDLFRDGLIAYDPNSTTTKATYDLAYDARYSDNYKDTSVTPTVAHNDLCFGGLPFGYRAIRVYNRTLTEAEMAQNHVADLFKFYGVAPEKFLSLDAEIQKVLTQVLSSELLGETSKQTIEAQIDAVTPRDYSDEEIELLSLYVQDGLIFSWDAMRMEEGGVAFTTLLNNIEGSDLAATFTETTATNHTAADGALLSKGVLQLGSLLPYHTVQNGDADIAVLDDVTVEVTLFQQDYHVPEGADQSGVFRMPNLSQQLLARNYDTGSGSSPANETYGFISGSGGAKGAPREGTADVRTAFDAGWISLGGTNAKLFGHTRLETYQVAFRFDYTVAEGEYEGILDLDFFRDALITQVPGDNSTRGSFDLAYDARYSDNYKSALEGGKTPTAAYNTLYFGKVPFGYRAIRVYDRALTDDEMKRNYFADMVCHIRPDLSYFRLLDNMEKQAIYDIYAGKSFSDVSKEELEAIFLKYAQTGGKLDLQDVDSYISFEGIQARTKDYGAFRLLYNLNMDEISILEKAGGKAFLGVLFSETATPEQMTARYDTAIGEVVAEESSVSSYAFYRAGEWGTKLDYLNIKDDGTADVAVALSEVLEGDLKTSSQVNCDYRIRAYFAVMIEDKVVINYLDFNDRIFGDTVSLFEVSEYFLCNGFSTSSILAAPCDDNLVLAAQAGQAKFEEANKHWSDAQSPVNVVVGAYAAVPDYLSDYQAQIEGILPTLGYAEALEKALELSTIRANLFASSKIGQSAYATATLLMDALHEANSARREAIAVAFASSDLTPDEIAALADRVVLKMEENTEYTGGLISDGEQPFVNAIASVNEGAEQEAVLMGLVGDVGSVSLNTRPIGDYILVTDDEHYDAALAIQKTIVTHYGALVGIYSIDNEYTGDCAELQNFSAIYVGLTDKYLADANGKDIYSIYAVDGSIYIEGTSTSAVSAGATTFTSACFAGKGSIEKVFDEGENAILGKTFVPMFTTNMQTTFPPVSISSYDANGVWEGFLQTVSEKPDEVTVLDRILPENFENSMLMQVFVSNDGDDTEGDGSKENPYETLDRALVDVSNRVGAVIWLRGGYYSPASLSAQHSGTESAPLFISAYKDEKVMFTSGKVIDPSLLVPVDDADFVTQEDKEIFNKFTPNNSQNIYAIDLTTVGFVKDDFKNFETGATSPSLYVGSQTYNVARFPNAGEFNEEMKIFEGRVATMNVEDGAMNVRKHGKVTWAASTLYSEHKNDVGSWEIYIDDTTYGARAANYRNEYDNLYMYGSVYEEWDINNFYVSIYQDDEGRNIIKHNADSSTWGCKKNGNLGFYFHNMPEDLDCEGEYLVDIEDMTLYVYGRPTENMTLAYDNTTLLDVQGASYVVLNGITFANSCGVGVALDRTDHVIVQGCDFNTLATYGVTINDTYMSGVTYSRFDRTLSINSSFTRALMNPTCSIIQNNVFNNENGTQDTSVIAMFAGFGDVISHNEFIDCNIRPGGSIELVFEYNYMLRGNQFVLDNGPFYVGVTSRGLHIRYNFLHNLNYSRYGIYLDDMSSGNYVYGNVIHYQEGRGGRCINIHNGQAHVIINNICINGGEDGAGAIRNQSDYAPVTINGKPTGAVGGGQNWFAIAGMIHNSYYTGNPEMFEKRYPMWTFITEVNERALPAMNSPHWVIKDKVSPAEDDEILSRTPAFNVYKNNLMYGGGGLNIPNFGRDMCIVDGNMTYLQGDNTDIGFYDFEGGDFRLKEDSIIYEENPEFKPLDPSRAGLTD